MPTLILRTAGPSLAAREKLLDEELIIVNFAAWGAVPKFAATNVRYREIPPKIPGGADNQSYAMYVLSYTAAAAWIAMICWAL